FVSHIESIGVIHSSGLFNPTFLPTDGKALDCPEFAAQAFMWWPQLRKKAFSDLNKEVVSMFENVKHYTSKRAWIRSTEIVKLYTQIYLESLNKCKDGDKEFCEFSEAVKENKNELSRAMGYLKSRRRNRASRSLLKEMQFLYADGHGKSQKRMSRK